MVVGFERLDQESWGLILEGSSTLSSSALVQVVGVVSLAVGLLVHELLMQRRVDYGGARWPDLMELETFSPTLVRSLYSVFPQV